MISRLAVAAVFALLSTLAQASPLGPDGESGRFYPGKFVWFDLATEDLAGARAFYGAVFDWQFRPVENAPASYTLIEHEGGKIGGMFRHTRPPGAQVGSRWLALMSVPDAARAADQAAASGGKILVPPKNLPGRGETSVLADPEGAVFGVIHTGTGDPPDEFPSYDAWLWLELWAKDASRMADFYRPIGNYTVARQEGPGDRTELHLMASGYPRAGILELFRKDLPTTWLPYVRVKDLQKTVSGVEQAGGRVVIKPSPEIRGGKVAVFLDPLGAAVAAAEWPDENEGEGKP